MAGTYPNLLAAGVDIAGRFDQFDLYAGDDEIVTESAQAADGQAISQFQVLTIDVDGRLTPWGATGEHAQVVGTFTGQPTANDTITINGIAFTFKAAADVSAAGDVAIGATDVETAANFVAVVNGTPDGVNPDTLFPTYGTAPLAGTGVTASLDTTGLVVTLSATEVGTGGNALPVAESASNFAFAGSATKLSGAEADHATGTLNFSSTSVNSQTVTINGSVITFVTSGATGPQVNIGTTQCATDIAALINSAPGTYGCTAVASGTLVTLTAIEEGLGGNSVTLAHSNTIPVLSGATLTGGGVSEPDPLLRPVGVAMQAVPAATPGVYLPYASGGVFNHEALIWPASVATLAQRRRAVAGTDLKIGQLL